MSDPEIISLKMFRAKNPRKWNLHLVFMTILYVCTGQSSGLSSLSNVALNKPASQSSQSPRFSTLTAAKAVDGNKSTYLYDCQHTADTDENDNNPVRWWMVDLQGFYEIHTVKVTNRGDCCASRLRDFDIDVFVQNPMVVTSGRKQICYHYDGPMGSGVTELLACSQPMRGRYVRLIMPSTGNPMHVCEVEVLAKILAALTVSEYTRETEQRASGFVLQEVTSYNKATSCFVACSQLLGCNAIDVRRSMMTSGGSTKVCRLLSFGGIGQPQSTDPDPEWDFYYVTDL